MSTVETRDLRSASVPPPLRASEREEEKSAELVAGGSVIEAVGGITAVVLGILGLAGMFPNFLAAIAMIGLGAALIFEGGAIAARYSRLLWETGDHRLTISELGSGMTAELLGGIAGVVLGVLALLNVEPLVLAPVAVIVFGGALLIGSGATARLNHLMIEHVYSTTTATRRVASEAVSAAAGAQVLVGLAAGVLGILALLGFHIWTFTLVALLCLGGSVLLSGTAVSGKLFGLLRH